jgi:hypothetical protein
MDVSRPRLIAEKMIQNDQLAQLTETRYGWATPLAKPDGRSK